MGIKANTNADMGTNINKKYVHLLQSTFEKYKSLDSPSSVETEDRDEGLKEIPQDNCGVKRKRRHKRDSREGTTAHAIEDNAGKYDVSKLLKKSFEKYQNMENVESVHERKESNKKKNLKSQDNSGGDALVNRKKKDKQQNQITGKNTKNKGKRRSGRYVQFSKEEDEMLLEAFNSAGIKDLKIRPRGFLIDLSRKMNRHYEAIKERYTSLTQKTRLYQVRFTLLDDKAVIDAAVENIKKVKNLRKSTIENIDELATKLSRSKTSLRKRWGFLLKPWIMSYYAKTLNLNIRIMLASFVAENFNTVYDIDWELVQERPEFSGQTLGSLKRVLGKMTEVVASHLNKPVGDVSLSEIAEDAKTTYASFDVKANTKKRQMEIIEYFESVIRLNKIENFL